MYIGFIFEHLGSVSCMNNVQSIRCLLITSIDALIMLILFNIISQLGVYQAHGCGGENIQLSCPDNRTIFVTHANYGEYGPTYTQPYCAPHPYNCYESVSVTDEDQWLYIKYLCDNQTTCSYPFEGSYFDTDCTPGSPVDYISIYYDCLPGLTH